MGAPGGGQHPLSPEFVFTFGRTAERTPGGVVLAAAGSRLAAGGDARTGLPGGGAGAHADYKSLQRGRRRVREQASRFPGTASASRPRVSASRRAATCARRPARPLRRGSATSARALRAWSCQGHSGGEVGPLCIPKQRAHLSAPLPPASFGVSMEVALMA